MKPVSKISSLRSRLHRLRLTGLIVPRQDEFQGESVCAYAERLHWISNSSGSWGLAIITQKKAALFVDGRYTTQAQQEVDKKTFDICHLLDASPNHWIETNLKAGDRLGFDPWLVTANQAAQFSLACKKAGAVLVAVDHNPIDDIWHDQPARPQRPVSLQPLEYAGKSSQEKLGDLRKAIASHAVDATVITLPDVIAWLFNLRGHDVAYTPVVLAYAIVPYKGKAMLFIDKAKITPEIKQALSSLVTFKTPESFEPELIKLGQKKYAVWLDKAWVSEKINNLLTKAGARIINKPDLCLLPKACKNITEQKGSRAAHQRDGVAMVRFLNWLEVTAAQQTLDELTVAQTLKQFRQDTGKLKDLSFETIPAAGPNAAIPHYHVHPETSLTLKDNSIFLIDSGGQYLDGTTDITRTIIIGTPTPEMKDRFTRVLKGMIALSQAKFPRGTTGSQLDILARHDLWQIGLDYDHGTGHGVGAYLSVHEGPARINKSDRTPLEVGMILSNEPGFYKPGQFGIRIENLVLVQEAEKIGGPDARPMLCFETLTLCPIDHRLIDLEMLSPTDIDWLNRYHKRVLKDLSPNLNPAERQWLEQACAPLSVKHNT